MNELYNLINRKNPNESGIICKKITIDNYDYYISEHIQPSIDGELYHCSEKGKGIDTGYGIPEQVLTISKYSNNRNLCENCKKVIATNNFGMEIPQVSENVCVAYEYYISNKNVEVSDSYHFNNGFTEARKLNEFNKYDIINLIESLKDYTHESNSILGHDERTAEDIFEIWNTNRIKTVYYDK